MDSEFSAHASIETAFRVDIDRPTAPPPPLHPSDAEPRRAQPTRASRRRLLRARLGDCADRAGAITSALRVGAMSREEAARLARTEIRAIELAATAAGDEALRGSFTRLRALMEEMGGIADEPSPDPLELLVVDGDPRSASTVALALELRGCTVRVVRRLADVARAARELPPACIFVSAAALDGEDALTISAVRDLAGGADVRVVVHGDASAGRLAQVAKRAGADAALAIDGQLDDPSSALDAVLARLGG